MCDHADIQRILQQHPRQQASMVGLLHDIQKRFRFLPEDALRATAEYLGVPVGKVFAVATFYKAFSLTPRGEHRVRVCTGTACHVRGSGLVIQEMEKALGVSRGQTTADMKHTLEAVNCVGACALAPVVMIDDEVHGAVTPASAPALLPQTRR
jgi:NADH-quinone oxidoreductase subunit E